MVDRHSLKHRSSNYTVPEMQSSEEEDSDDEKELYIPYLLMSEDDNQSADEVLQSYGVVQTQCNTKTVWKEIMDGVYVPPKKLEGGQWQNEVVLNKSPEANNGDARAQIQPWSSHRKD